MKKQLFALSIFVTCTFTLALSQQVLSVTPSTALPNNDVSELIRNHLTGAGMEILSVVYEGDPHAIGYFTDGDTAIGLNRGLMMTTGYVESTDATGANQASDGNLGGGVQAELLAALPGADLNDVAYFRITFRPFSDSIRFRYSFASEEYPEYACSQFNDIFGFFLSGPNPIGGVYDDLNIALIPGTNLPVAINNLHPNNPDFAPCPPTNEQFYHDNEDSNKQPIYDGFTDIFIAEASVVPCGTYEMVIAIADVLDSGWDSAVYLEAKSLESEIVILSSLEIGDAIVPEVATADTISFTFAEVPAHLLPLQIKIAGTATNGIDFQPVNPVTTVSAQGEVVYFVIQPIQDSLQEQLETVEFNVCGTAANECFLKTYTLYIADPDSLYSPSDSVFFQLGGAVLLSVAPTSVSNKSWTFSNTAQIVIGQAMPMTKSEVSIDIPFDILHDLSILQSVCFNIEHDWDGDLNIYLIAPNETFVELSTTNGGNGDNYSNTCFSPSATEDIRGGLPFAPASAAPFTGTFQPEGFWSDIIGTPITGTWGLGILDAQAGIAGTLLDWAITFSTHELGNFKYHWSTNDTTPSILVNAPGTYSVTVSNQVGLFSKMFVVEEGIVGTQTPAVGGQAFLLFPNPSTGETELTLNKNVKVNAVKVYDLHGALLLEQHSTGPILGASALPNGVYIVALECADGVFVQKLLRW
ncbi:MAG: choice-of-anchor L domain-containing protein [Saprospiraceae bacterium]